jgi:hypothetical protein
MSLTRRELLASAAGLLAAPAASPPVGVASFSYSFRLGREPELRDPLRFLQFCRERGAVDKNPQPASPKGKGPLDALEERFGTGGCHLRDQTAWDSSLFSWRRCPVEATIG